MQTLNKSNLRELGFLLSSNKHYLMFILLMMLFSCATKNASRIDNLPMYDQPEITRPPKLVKADQGFIAKVTSELGSREETSKLW